MEEVLKYPEAIQALNDLDIESHDHKYLADILDPDNNGSIRIVEFIDGLKRLRGEPRRSDIVAVDLMIRSLHQKITDISNFFGVKPTEEAAPLLGFEHEENLSN